MFRNSINESVMYIAVFLFFASLWFTSICILFPQAKSFLFMEKLKGNQEDATQNKLSPSNQKAKKQEVSAGRRRILEAERQRVVEAYRSMKASKHSLA